MENKINWWLIIAIVVVVAVVSSLITVNLTGNIIKVNNITTCTQTIYTKTEIDAMFTACGCKFNENTTVPPINTTIPVSNATGKLVITSKPSGASVLVNGVSKGATPLNLTLTVGNYNITLSKTGCLSNITVKSILNTTNFLNITLASNPGSFVRCV